VQGGVLNNVAITLKVSSAHHLIVGHANRPDHSAGRRAPPAVAFGMLDVSLAQMIAFNATLAAAILSPGPAMLLSVRNSIAEGRAVGVATGLGLATMAAIWTGCALLGLAALFEIVPWLYGAMKFVGAAYLIYLAIGMWRNAAQPMSIHESGQTSHSVLWGFRSGLLINLSNPKSVLFAGAVIVVIFPAGLSAGGTALIVVNHLMLEVFAYTCFALALSTPMARRAFSSGKTWFDRVAGTVMGALGVRLLLDRSS
ncbi:MAG: LysE family transporter, partial [Pseudomonadota bacterium]